MGVGLRSLLAVPAVYSLFWWGVGTARSRRVLVQDHIRARAGDRVLDIGCGPAEILAYLPEVDYLGVDASPEYVAAARRKFQGRGRFECATVNAAAPPEAARYDLVLALGVLHHLDDAEATRLMELAAHALRPGGRLITFDGAYTERQGRLARWVVSRDRGQHVRAPGDYERLARKAFSEVRVSVRDGLLRIPYTHAIMECART